MNHNVGPMERIPTLEEFDRNSGNVLERLFFNNRVAVIAICAVVTLVLGWQASQLRLNASFEKTIPVHQAYIANYLKYQSELAGLGNAVRIAVANKQGTIYDAEYLATLSKINDDVFTISGVDRNQMKSLWTPTTRWTGVTEEGLEGGPVIPDDYDGSPRTLQMLQINVARSGEIGQIVALDQKSSIIYVPLLAKDAEGNALDYSKLSRELERVRAAYGSDKVSIHITGFAKIVGDLIEGLRVVLVFFGIAILIAMAMVFWYTRCVRSTLLVVLASLGAVVWQLGIIRWLGYDLDPYSMLVPFLVFAIGMSHGAQKMNGIMQDVGRGAHKLVAARYTFRRLFLAGLTALLANAVGFAVLLIIDIKVIGELATAASIGVGVLIFTNLILLPILLSFTGVSAAAAARSLRAESNALSHPDKGVWAFIASFTSRGRATATVIAGALLFALGMWGSHFLKIGDLDPGAPELRPDSRYNRDVAFMNQAYGASSDVFAVMVKTPDGVCADYATLMKVDTLDWELRQIDGVESTSTLAGLNRRVLMGMNEANPRWYELLKNQSMLNLITAAAPRGLYNDACNLLTVYVFLRDHRADTLDRVLTHVEGFAAANDTEDVKFLMAAGSAGIEAATNIVVKYSWRQMLMVVYASVIILAFITFRSWRAVLIAVVPLLITSMLAEALMVALGIGVKVATLPVVALGVGVGVDYALYILSVTLARMREGLPLGEAYRRALLFTGKVVMLTGFTLSLAVATWAFSPIKFQADMGKMLAFMFLWNMLGALFMLPALAHFLLPSVGAVTSPAAKGAPVK